MIVIEQLENGFVLHDGDTGFCFHNFDGLIEKQARIFAPGGVYSSGGISICDEIKKINADLLAIVSGAEN